MIKKITSLSHALVKSTTELKQKKERTRRREFVVEGSRSIEEVFKGGYRVAFLFVTTSAMEQERVQEIIDTTLDQGGDLIEVSDNVMNKIADTQTPSGVFAIVKHPTYTLEKLNEDKTDGLILVLDEVRDPGNLGAIIRTADAVGVKAIFLLKGCTDLYASKTIRATMGSVFHLPVISDLEKEECIEWCKNTGHEIVVSTLEEAESLYDVKVNLNKTALVVGNEAAGVSEEFFKAADKKVYIPMQGKAESLNVAMATGIMLFEFARRNK